jgi:hypothetical protein
MREPEKSGMTEREASRHVAETVGVDYREVDPRERLSWAQVWEILKSLGFDVPTSS